MRHSIRPVAEEDQAEWLRMRRALWPDCAETMHRFELQRYAAAPGGSVAVFVCDGDGRLGGFVEVSIRDRVDGSFSDRVALIEGWYVDPELRGQGLGRLLIERAEQWARDRGLSELASDAEITNEPSLRAHEALGFKETFRLVHYLKPLRTHF